MDDDFLQEMQRLRSHFGPWVKEAPWGSARKARKEHVDLYHAAFALALLTPAEVEWGADRLCPICMRLRESGYAKKWDDAWAEASKKRAEEAPWNEAYEVWVSKQEPSVQKWWEPPALKAQWKQAEKLHRQGSLRNGGTCPACGEIVQNQGHPE